ncbi:mucin-7-like [Haliotis rufescens]|uniref:mucin-7-like n=1 Tax=Haliotis rufescens TaxID=6454 RepID=UPI00201F4194|nr:mucin-7-like [Haliotis rufescens]
MTDTRIITQADIHCTDTPTPSEAHNTSDRTPETLIPHEFGKPTTVASPTKTSDSPAITTNPPKRKLDASNTTPTSPSIPASMVTFALYFCAAGPINTLRSCTPWCIHCKTTNHSSLSNKCPHKHTLTQQANRHIDIDSAKLQTRKLTQHPRTPLLPTPQPNNKPHLQSLFDGIPMEIPQATATNTQTPHFPPTFATPKPVTASTPARKPKLPIPAISHPNTIQSAATRATTTRHEQATPENANITQPIEIPSTTQQNTQTTPMDSEDTNLINLDDSQTETQLNINDITRSAPKNLKNRKRRPQTQPEPETPLNTQLNNFTLLLLYLLKEIKPDIKATNLHQVARRLNLTNQTYPEFYASYSLATAGL